MHRNASKLLTLVLLITFSELGQTAPPELNPSTTIEAVLKANLEKRVTIRLVAGAEMTGLVKAVNQTVVHLSELSGKEFYDAVIFKDAIIAVVVRSKDI